MTDTPPAPRPTPRYEQILAAAARTADDFGHTYVGTEHLLLALLADKDAIATQAIERFVPPTRITEEIHRVIASEGYNTPHMWRPEH
jgi:ATP-dependent Clp protease ATP-binding subunit ClpA